MRKLFGVLAILIASNVMAEELHQFDQVKAAVLDGKSVRIVVDFSKCSSDSKQALQINNMVGAFTPNEIIIDSKGQIMASLMHFTLSNRSSPAKPMFQFVRYTLTADNNVIVESQPLDVISYAPISDKYSCVCKIDVGAKIIS